jgi:hypothetical protein
MATPPPSSSSVPTTPALRMSSNGTDEEVRKLLAKARALREEAALMSGKTIEEMERERLEMKEAERERRVTSELARRERKEANAAARWRGGESWTLPVPEDAAAQARQAASEIERAFADGLVRQTVRLALLAEGEVMSDHPNELYREAGRPLDESLLREVRAYAPEEEDGASSSSSSSSAGRGADASSPNGSRAPPVVTARDIWDFDGSALITARSASGPRGDVWAIVFPNTDTKYLWVMMTNSEQRGTSNTVL